MIVLSEPIRHAWADCKLAIISGLSNPNCCRLAERQYSLLKQLNSTTSSTLFLNFPYIDRQFEACDPACEPQSMPDLLSASMANSWQCVKLQFSGYRNLVRKHWQSITSSCRSLNLISLSSGLEIIRRCMVATAEGCRLNILALGSVSLGLIDLNANVKSSRWSAVESLQCITGSRDWISRCLNRSRLATRVAPNVGHMDYLESPYTRSIIEEWVCNSISAS